MNDCLFCKIITGEIPSAKIYEDENSFAFLDINPTNTGHTLLVPKEHSRNIFDINKNTLKQLMPPLQELSIAVKNGVGVSGVNIQINNEPTAGQVIFHTHIHIIPRFKDDKIKMWKGGKYKKGEIEELVKKIKKQL